MIAKGVPNAHGARLARYLISGKECERAELLELRGFAAPGIVEAFRAVNLMARASKCVFPFFHVSVRNPDGEALDAAQWTYAANAIEQSLGLTDQPRAIAFHICEESGESHMHVAWSRIDQEKLTAKPLPFFKERLKRVSRELEKNLGLTEVSSSRKGSIAYAPTRKEEEQARRLGINLGDHRESIRNCFEHSDCGRSFQRALESRGMLLAQGERRDFIVIDRAGGIHALGKRILGLSAAQLRERLSDLARESLPTVDQARGRLIAQGGSRKRDGVQEGNRPRGPREISPSIREEMPRPSSDRTAEDELESAVSATLPTITVVPPETVLPESLDGQGSDIPIGQPIDHVEQVQPEPDMQEHPSFIRAEQASDPPEPEMPAPRAKTAGFAGALKSQFRALVRAIVKRTPPPKPQTRRRRGETVGSFRSAARSILRPIIRLPGMAQTIACLNDTLHWLHLWEWNETAEQGVDTEPSSATADHFSPHP